jgi:prepilin-type N-terminal cleavage/methylation domain-containing protein
MSPGNVLDKCRGFTIVEMAMVLAIIGLLVFAGFSYLDSSMDNARMTQTREKMKTIEKAIYGFFALNNRLPCSADPTLAVISSNSGQEYCTGTKSYKVTSTPSGFTTDTSDQYVIAGSVPVDDLFLPKEFLYDGWNNKFEYVVTRALAGSGAGYGVPSTLNNIYNTNMGLITINDGALASIVNNAAFAIISHGKNGYGAWNSNGNVMSFPASPNAQEKVNSSSQTGWSASLVAKLFPTITDHVFDDIVIYSTKNQLVQGAGYFVHDANCTTAYSAANSNLNTICASSASPPPDQDCQSAFSLWVSKLNAICLQH